MLQSGALGPPPSRRHLSPRHARAAFAAAAAFWVSGLPGCAAESSSSESGAEALVGGAPAAATEFLSTLALKGGCTAAKVGPHHILTAAHCVHDKSTNTLRSGYRAGATVYVTNRKTVSKLGLIVWPTSLEDFRGVEVRETLLPEPWTADWPSAVEKVNVLGADAPPDVALIVATAAADALLADIPTATVDTGQVLEGDRVTVMGYGCEGGVYGASPWPDFFRVQLRYQDTHAIGLGKLVHPGSYVDAIDSPYAQNLGRSYLFTPGKNLDPAEASICPGDSGAPIYRADRARNTIVGVNAYYSFLPKETDPKGISVTNWHTRLDAASRWDIGGWLARNGAQTK